MRVRILHWNAWFQEKVENVLEVIEQAKPNIVCLQELTINSVYNNGKDVPKIISEKLNMIYNFAPAQKFGDGHIIGNGIFSKHPIIKNSNFFISDKEDYNDYSLQARVCAVSKISLSNGKNVILATTHSSYNNKFVENERKVMEIRKLLDFLKKHKDKIIFTGDLNIPPESKSIRLIEEQLSHCGPEYSEPTWTTKFFSYKGFEEDKLRWRLDYAFASKDIKVISSKILKTEYSDHLPILLEVEL